MAVFKGTEGEWILDDTSRNYNLAVVTEEKTIAIISDDNRLSDDEIEANAKVIVQAKNLLEALIDILPFAEEFINKNHPAHIKAIEIIKKATE
jgi:hypothetical protein